MASAPPEAPQTIVLSGFSGMKNTVSEERLKQDELFAAVNVDIDDVGQLRRRRGLTPRGRNDNGQAPCLPVIRWWFDPAPLRPEGRPLRRPWRQAP